MARSCSSLKPWRSNALAFMSIFAISASRDGRNATGSSPRLPAVGVDVTVEILRRRIGHCLRPVRGFVRLIEHGTLQGLGLGRGKDTGRDELRLEARHRVVAPACRDLLAGAVAAVVVVRRM